MALTVLVGTYFTRFCFIINSARPIFIYRYSYPMFLVYLAFTLSLVIPHLEKLNL